MPALISNVRDIQADFPRQFVLDPRTPRVSGWDMAVPRRCQHRSWRQQTTRDQSGTGLVNAAVVDAWRIEKRRIAESVKAVCVLPYAFVEDAETSTNRPLAIAKRVIGKPQTRLEVGVAMVDESRRNAVRPFLNHAIVGIAVVRHSRARIVDCADAPVNDVAAGAQHGRSGVNGYRLGGIVGGRIKVAFEEWFDSVGRTKIGPAQPIIEG